LAGKVRMSDLLKRGRSWLSRTFGWSNTPQAWIERAVAAALCSGVLLLAWFHARLTTAQLVIFWGLLLVATAFVARRGWLILFGPILFYDLMCTARRPRYFLIRYLFALLLALLLCFSYWYFTSEHPDQKVKASEAAVFAEYFFQAFVMIQYCVLIVLTPAYVAGTIAEEKERKTLEFILATDLRNREIVLGKLCSRIANLMLLLLTGLPILSLVQFMGGVDPTLVVAWYAATALSVLSLASFSMLNSVLNRKPRDAVAVTYFCLFGYLVLSGVSWLLTTTTIRWAWLDTLLVTKCVYAFNTGNPFAMFILIMNDFEAGKALDKVVPTYMLHFAIFHGAVCMFSWVLSVALLRTVALKQAFGLVRRRFRFRLGRRPHVGPAPLLWKEVCVESGLRLNFVGRIVLALLIAASLASIWYVLDNPSYGSFYEVVGVWSRVTGTVGACLLLMAVAGRAATSISNEREKQTLDALLTCPVNSDAILFSKWVGAVLTARWGLFWLSSVYVLGILTGALHWLTLPLVLLGWSVYAAAAAMIGLWFSVVCKSGLRATIGTYMATVGLGVGHWLLWMCAVPLLFVGDENVSRAMTQIVAFELGFTPPYALGSSLCIPANSYSNVRGVARGAAADGAVMEGLGYGLAGLCCWLFITGMLWAMTTSRFKLVCGRSTLAEPQAPPLPTRGGLAPAANV
jgi:ABC-type transport system involved in multi-copper enzyme maturation permease subunit